MKSNIVAYFLPITLIYLIYACNSHEQEKKSPEIKKKNEKVDYESEALLSKFINKPTQIDSVISYEHEICKINFPETINYPLIDSLLSNGTDINEPFYYTSSGGLGFGFKFSIKKGFSKSTGTGSHQRERTAIEMALEAYSRPTVHKSQLDKPFNLIHFLLSRGVNPNKEGLEPLYKYFYKSSSFFSSNKENIDRLFSLYEFYGFDIKKLNLSACNNRQDALAYLIDKGAIHFDMNTFDFESDLQHVYDQKEELQAKGIIFDFSKIDGNTFPFESDTSSLILMLDMGLSPYHITPEGKDLRNDFGPFCEEALKNTLDNYRKNHPNRK